MVAAASLGISRRDEYSYESKHAQPVNGSSSILVLVKF